MPREIQLNALTQLKHGESAVKKPTYSKLEIPIEFRIESVEKDETDM